MSWWPYSKPRQITRQLSWYWKLWLGLYIAIPLSFAIAYLPQHFDHSEVIFAGFIIAAVIATVRHLMTYKRVEKHNKALQAFVASHQLPSVSGNIGYLINQQTLGAISDIHNAQSRQTSNIIEGNGWLYSEFSYKLYGRSKYGEFVRATVYYSVMSTKLARPLPNVFFDSKKARGRQFRFQFSRDQLHSLEGDFDRYFATYFPPDYTVDSMSFISPEVMWAMREASDYDIEIVGDRLYLYGPLYDPNVLIPDMIDKLAEIKRRLNDNIVTYRDERLPFAEGRRAVAPQGARLTASIFWKVFGVVVFILWLILELWAKSS